MTPNPTGQTPDLCIVFLENAFYSEQHGLLCMALHFSQNVVPGRANAHENTGNGTAADELFQQAVIHVMQRKMPSGLRYVK